MRSFVRAAVALAAVALFAAPAQPVGHPLYHHHYVPVGGYYAAPAGYSTQGIPPALISGLLGGLPGFLGGLTGGQFNWQLPNLNPGGGGLLPSTPVPTDVAAKLNEVDKDLDRILKASQALQPKPTVDKSKSH
jgi:hypothetical protein